MLLFCPNCGNLVLLEDSATSLRFSCGTCPYICNVKRKMTNQIYPILKEIDKVMGGPAAYENADSTDAVCPKCSNDRAYFIQIQIRSADEPMTTFFKCCRDTCQHMWKD
ncbi:DNA-directed RNA polymerase III subunit RPC10 [Pseudolycoriella hygida]|uniref:DNA-directed RNA polymerase subunit n=1 Tax=Pseudolycoriella hygida TaxID=35572 RepID=A0A9Q0N5P8_9DIPT|nr:DNA-directed RNA polymerase III subunit RPC10 [Pseudolycoriella hygida]